MKPILFNTEMVRAILDGRKTATRRIVKPQPGDVYSGGNVELRRHTDGPHNGEWHCYREMPPLDKWTNRPWGGQIKPPYQTGDILYVRETWNTTDDCGLFPPWPSTGIHYMYLADAPESQAAKDAKWRPSIHMPKAAARIFLRVTDVRAEQLQEITTEDCYNEGVPSYYEHFTRLIINGKDYSEEPEMIESFSCLWDSTIKKKDLPLYGWDANPWVWVTEFERVEENDVEAH